MNFKSKAMQKHKFSVTALLPIALFVLITGLFVYFVEMPPISFIFLSALLSIVIWQMMDRYRNRGYRDMRRFEMNNSLIVLPSFHADEKYESSYNGYTLHIDHLRGQLALVNPKLEVRRLRFSDIEDCYYDTDYLQHQTRKGRPKTYTTLRLVIETKTSTEPLVYTCFEARQVTGRLRRSLGEKDKRYVCALTEVEQAVERIQCVMQ